MHSVSAGKVVPVPNVTPMIDVMLVLLCIFMIMTPAMTNGVVAEPPVAENLKPRPEEGPDHTMAIDLHGSIFLDRKPLSPERLRAALTALFPSGASDHVLYVRADKDLDFGVVRAALDIASASGVKVVALVSEQKSP